MRDLVRICSVSVAFLVGLGAVSGFADNPTRQIEGLHAASAPGPVGCMSSGLVQDQVTDKGKWSAAGYCSGVGDNC